MKKILFVASVTKHINTFHIPYLKYFKDKGYEVHVASNGGNEIKYCDKHFDIEFERSPLKKENISAYKKLKKIINEQNYDIIHCHTPVASVLTRIAAKKARRFGTKVIYTAHGFHFFKGAPLKNWLFFYPVEKALAKYTDKLITINEEDFAFAKKKIKAKDIVHVHGVGVDEHRFSFELSETDKNLMRSKFTVGPLDFLMIYVAELSDRKNQIMLLEAMKKIVETNPNVKLILAGSGSNQEKYEKYVTENFLQNNVLMLGYRTDIPELLKISDLYVSTSKFEGLPVNIMEAMVSGLPVVATNSRGQRELIEDGKNGYLVELGDIETFVNRINSLYSDTRMKEFITQNAKESVSKFALSSVYEEMKAVYEQIEEK